MSSITSFALNNACTATVNFDPFFGFHSYTLEGKSVTLSAMDESDLLIVRKVLEERYNFYKTARELVEYITKLINESKEKSAPKEVCKYKQMLNETFGITFEEMEGRDVASSQLVERTCEQFKAMSDFTNWKVDVDPAAYKTQIGDVFLEFEFKGGDGYVYAKMVKCGDVWGIHTRVHASKTAWQCINCADVLDALNFVAKRFW